jgi:hypothetical protein
VRLTTLHRVPRAALQAKLLSANRLVNPPPPA